MYHTETIIHYTRHLFLQSVLQKKNHAKYSFRQNHRLETLANRQLWELIVRIYNYTLVRKQWWHFGVVYHDDVPKSNALYVERFASLAARPSLAARVITKRSWISIARRVRRCVLHKNSVYQPIRYRYYYYKIFNALWNKGVFKYMYYILCCINLDRLLLRCIYICIAFVYILRFILWTLCMYKIIKSKFQLLLINYFIFFYIYIKNLYNLIYYLYYFI